MQPQNLRCEYLVNPIGIDSAKPRLFWTVASRRRGDLQTAYQILVASSADKLNADQGDLWDSGMVRSDESTHITYNGKPLASRQRAWWKVRVWNRDGQVSEYSKPAFWEMGLSRRDDWQAKWIGLPDTQGVEMSNAVRWIWVKDPAASDPVVGVRFFRTSLSLPAGRKVREAQALVLADNLFELYINGRRVIAGSGWQNYHVADLTEQLVTGENAVAIVVNNTDGPGGLAAQVQVTFEDGTSLLLVTDERWKASAQQFPGWEQRGADVSGWNAPEVLGAPGIQPWGKPARYVPPGPAPLLRREFLAPAKLRRARIYASAKGLYKLFVNGRPVSKDVFRPGWTDYRKRIQYQSYDVTDLIRPGSSNALGVILGDGWYCGHIAWAGRRNYGPMARALIQLEMETEDGRVQRVVSDGTWRVTQGPILFSDLLMGEHYDARKEIPGWSLPGIDESRWGRPEVEPLGEVPLVAQRGPSVVQVATLKPLSVTEKPGNTFVFDLGQNMVGWARLKVRGPAGTTVRLRFAEMLNPDGTIYTTNLRSARATDYYTLRGRGTEVYEPSFTFHGFRYVEVTGYPGKPDRDAVTGIVVSQGTPQTGTFVCSHPMVNQLQHNIFWGQRGNYLEVPTDCPQRDERLGWMGDAQVFIRTACYNNDVAGFMQKWVQDVVDAQSPQGAFSDVSPRIAAAGDGAPAWGDAGVIVPWTVYRFYGDRPLLAAHFDAMARWIEWIREGNPDLIWRNRSGNNYGDWLNINAETPKDLLATAYFACSTRLVAQAARVLGRTADAERYEQLFQQIRSAFQKTFVRPDGRILSADGKTGDTQTCYLLALHFDLLPPEMRPVAARHLVADIMEKRNGHLSTGFVGVGYLNPVLTQMGYLNVAYRLLLNDTFPSWGYSIKHGATTIWERWDGWTAEKGFQDPGMNSFNHYALGSVGEWLYSTVAGIDLDPEVPGYKRFVLRPLPGGGLTYARATLNSLHGRIVSDWKIENGIFHYRCTIPANTVATVYLPTGDRASVKERGRPAERVAGVRFLRMEGNAAVYEVGSGNYTFTCALATP